MYLHHEKGKLQWNPVPIKRGIQQSDGLNPLRLYMALNPLSHTFNSKEYRFLTKGASVAQYKLIHLWYVDDVKLYASTDYQMTYLQRMMERFSDDIRMFFGLDKCRRQAEGCIPILTYSFGLVKWTNIGLADVERVTRQVLTKYRVCYPKEILKKIYLPRKEGGRILIDIQLLCKKQIANLQQYFAGQDTALHIAMRKSDNNCTPLDLSHERAIIEVPSHTEKKNMPRHYKRKNNDKGESGKWRAENLKQAMSVLKAAMQFGQIGLPKEEVKNVVSDYIVKNKIQTPFQENRPGDDWWYGFKKRFKLCLKKPERVEGPRARQADDPFIIADL
ncbi:hypothetical protein ILUMI_03032 [Ignelater luminosus]|uniref:Reverse transcriptase domain-containing protein n=1 Tax=Ignelater luminosus TaxID=2038154 RepID=A0A8K0DBJ6_IGNLU|nr:hypothetical protein ILUMI_03032 [Ignelater luminosus]